MIHVYRGRLFTSLPGLREVREERGLSARELGEKSGVSYVNILRVENGQQKATMASFEKLAMALGVGSLEELLLDDASKEFLAERRGALLET